MDFYEVLDDVLELLRSRGRVTYRALKVQFQLDDEQLETLKEEILYAHESAIQVDDRGLTWTGETEATPVTTSQADQPEPQPVVEQAQPIQATSSPVETHIPEAERRQLTVMFCDLVGSTELSGQFDAEDYREVVREYQKVCTDVIQRYDGYVAQLLGDGLLVYFGYPVAHEDDAQRAVRSGVGIIEAIGALNTRLEQSKGIRLAIRLGIHTGLVVVGEMGGEGRQEQLALGEVPNIASRIQGLAEPDTLVISEATSRLTHGYFDCEPLGEHDLRGVSQPIAVYRVLGDTGIQSRLDVASARGLTPLVGRESEVTLLLERWEQAKEGQGQVVLLSGEAGIGKSRLVQALKGHVTEQPHTRLECRSSPYFTNSALYPITDFLQRTLRFQVDDTPEKKLEKLEENLSQYRIPLEETVPLFATLFSLTVPEDRYSPLNLAPQRQRQKTLESIVAILLELAERQPVLFILEDLHWTDPTTLELLELLINQTPTASLYVLATCRLEFQPPWSHRSYLTEVTVNRLSRSQMERLAEQVAGGKALPDEIIRQLVEKTDGVPLYVEEMTKAVLESGILKEVNGEYELSGPISSLTIPVTLQDSLMSRLDRLVTAKAVAQYASVIGRQFSYDLLWAVSELDEATLRRELRRLVDAELVYQRGVVPNATYPFKHALVQDTAYESLLRSTRQQVHARIAQVLAEQFPETAENQPELLAHHFTEAGLNEQAVGYWHHAGQRASDRSAHVETINYLHKGLELLATLPETADRHRQELSMQTVIGLAYFASKGQGAPEVERTLTRARELCHHVGDTPQLFRIILGLRRYYFLRAEFQPVHELEDELLHLAQATQETDLLLEAHRVKGTTLCALGIFTASLSHLEQAYALYNQDQHRTHAVVHGVDPGTISLSWMSVILWILGYPEQGRQRSQAAHIQAQSLSHAYSVAMASSHATRFYQLCRETQAVREQAEATIALATEQGFPLCLSVGTVMLGWALAKQGHLEEGLSHIYQGLEVASAVGLADWHSYFLTLLAELHGERGDVHESLRALEQALEFVDESGHRFFAAEPHRLKGQLLLQQSSSNASEAESCYQKALEVSRHQQAKSWELRASTSLARLWQSQGKRQEAYDLLAPVYNWFTEGFDTLDLIDAKDLLNELEG